MEIEVKEFDEIVGTEYKEPIVFVLYRNGKNVAILNKKNLPADAIYMGKGVGVSAEEWWSPEYFKERIKIEARK